MKKRGQETREYRGKLAKLLERTALDIRCKNYGPMATELYRGLSYKQTVERGIAEIEATIVVANDLQEG